MSRKYQYKLPKYMWRKGMSKFLIPRAKQEGITSLMWLGHEPHESILSQLHRKYANQANFVTKLS